MLSALKGRLVDSAIAKSGKNPPTVTAKTRENPASVLFAARCSKKSLTSMPAHMRTLNNQVIIFRECNQARKRKQYSGSIKLAPSKVASVKELVEKINEKREV